VSTVPPVPPPSPARIACEEAIRRLDDFLDGELTGRESRLVEAHLAACERCARHHRFERRAIDAVRGKLRRAPVDPSLRARITRALDLLAGTA
jgi:anti-sigma factor (TIGR02949 family)